MTAEPVSNRACARAAGQDARAAVRVGLVVLWLALPVVGLGQQSAGVVYVDGTVGNDNWDGRCAAWDGGTCGPKATIQAGINVAVTGDQVLIADGTYTGVGNRDLDFAGKAITVRSAGSDPTACIIDCEGQGRGFYFHSGETAASILQSVTIRNGNRTPGGGVYCRSSSPTLADCTITGNTASYHYGGNGGGVACDLSNLTLTNCTITGNTATDQGSGLGGWGGGLVCGSSHPVITNCAIAGNTASDGGGVYFYTGSYATLTNCAIVGNRGHEGGGVYCYYLAGPTLTNCTIAGNTAAHYGGVYCYSGSDPTLTNSILWGDIPNEIDDFGYEVTYCDVQGGCPGIGNINADPLFVDPDGPDGDPATWADNDYWLRPGSPCIDTGDPAFVPSPGESDLDGHTRLWDGDADGVVRVDMGAYEFTGARGDLNCDGAVNLFDIDPFVLAVTNPAAYSAAYQDCDYTMADANADGAVNVFDIDPFVLLLTGGR